MVLLQKPMSDSAEQKRPRKSSLASCCQVSQLVDNNFPHHTLGADVYQASIADRFRNELYFEMTAYGMRIYFRCRHGWCMLPRRLKPGYGTFCRSHAFGNRFLRKPQSRAVSISLTNEYSSSRSSYAFEKPWHSRGVTYW